MRKKIIFAILAFAISNIAVASDSDSQLFDINSDTSNIEIMYKSNNHEKHIYIPVSGIIKFNTNDISKSSVTIIPNFQMVLDNDYYPCAYKEMIEYLASQSIHFNSTEIKVTSVPQENHKAVAVYELMGSLSDAKGHIENVTSYADSYTAGSTSLANGNVQEQLQFEFHTQVIPRVLGINIPEVKVRTHITATKFELDPNAINSWLKFMNKILKPKIDQATP